MDSSFRAASIGWMRRMPPWGVGGKIVARLRPRRVPVVLQLGPVECGAACLAMILGYYGRAARVSECREACGIGRDGVDARALGAAAQSYGLRAKAYSLEPASVAHLPLPAIVHWNFNHFVVLERWSPAGATIVDPAVGRCRVSAREFDEAFTGVALTLEPGPHFAPRRAARGDRAWIAYLFAAMRRTPGLLAQTLVASLLLELIGLALPVLTGMLVDDVLPLHISAILPTLGLGLLILLAAQAVVAYLRAALLTLVQGRLDAQLMLGFVEHLLTLPLDYFQRRATGDLLTRLGSNAVIRDAVTGQTIALILDSLFVLGYLAVLLARDAIFGMVVLAVAALYVGLLLGTTPAMRACVQRGLVAQAAAQSALVEALKGIATLKASAAEQRACDRWTTLFYKELSARLRRNRLVAVVDTLSLSLRTLAPLALLWVGAVRVLDGAMSLGTMLGLNALAALVLMPLSSLAAGAQQLQALGAHVERIADVMEAEPERVVSASRSASPLRGHVELRNVSFCYTAGAPPTLRDVSLTIQPGQKVALVGRTGSGKSTLAMLLLGLHMPSYGEILYDGIPLHSLDPRIVRRRYGVVLQEPFLFAGSMRQNIAFNSPDLPLEDVMTAARRAAIHDDITRLPMGYETLVGEGGIGLSGGQRQRLALARALAHEPAILLLDEATSALDVATECQIEQNLRALACTRIVIAHRLSTVRDADVIVVLDDGAIVEQGTHDTLLTSQGYYAALARHQGMGPVAAELPGN